MKYNDNLKVAWATPMRTATRSCIPIQKILNFDDLYENHIMTFDKGKEDYYLVLNIRHPYSRLVSLFKLFCIHKNKKFEIEIFSKWIKSALDKKNEHLNYYTVYLDHLLSEIPKEPDVYIRTEFLESDLKELWFVKENMDLLEDCFTNNIVNNPFKNEYTDYIPWQSFYDQDLADFVYSRLENQFKIFNYNKDYWKDGTP
jgi:hypothetical protein